VTARIPAQEEIGAFVQTGGQGFLRVVRGVHAHQQTAVGQAPRGGQGKPQEGDEVLLGVLRAGA